MPVNLFYTIADGSTPPKKSRVEVPLEDGLTLANYTGAIEAVWDLINPLTNGRLVSAGFTVEVDISEFTNPAAAAIADVQEKVEFVFRTVGGFIKRLNIPAVVETIFGGSGASDTVDMTNTDVQAFTLAMTAGIPDVIDENTNIDVVDSHGDVVSVLEVGRENWGKRRL